MPKRKYFDCSNNEVPHKKISAEVDADIKPGIILTDMLGGMWKLGKPVGTGGFGEIFLAACVNDKEKTDIKYVAKVENHKSGPLFVEINCYLRIAKPNLSKYIFYTYLIILIIGYVITNYSSNYITFL